MDNKYINFTGCSQKKRFPKALQKGYVKIDEKTFEENLAYTYGLSKFINHFDTDGTNYSDWSEFMIDEAVVLAAISFINPADIEAQFKKDLQKFITFNNPVKKKLYLSQSINHIHTLALRFDTWYNNLKLIEDFINDEVNIRNEISNVISQKLQSPFNTFRTICFALIKNGDILFDDDIDFNSLNPIWHIDINDYTAYEFSSNELSEIYKTVYNILQIIFQNFYESLIYIRQKAISYFDRSLKSDHHFPEIALLLSFFELYKYPQEHINELTQKYKEYYYRNILQQHNKASEDAQVFLKFTLDSNIEEATVPKDSLFIAGSDSTGKNILFGSDYEIEINKAELIDVKNIFLERDIISNARYLNDFVGNIYCNKSLLEENDNKPLKKYHAIFGESQQGKGEADRNMNYAQVGYAISSPVLLLKSGYREIDLTIDFNINSFDILKKKIDGYSKLLNVSYQEMLAKCFTDAFIIQLSSENGWLTVTRHVVSINEKTHSLSIRFDINSVQPAIIKPDTDIHGDNYNSQYPILKIYMNSNAYVFPYYLFNNSILEQISVQVKVKGLKELDVHNNIGPVNINMPFFPFGPVPTKGSYMIIGNNEVFQKELDELSINAEWFELPEDNLGFYNHYKDYGTKTTNSSFEATISVLNNGVWLLESKQERQNIKLFRTAGKENSESPVEKSLLSSQLLINNIDISRIKQEYNYRDLNSEINYSSLTKRGFLKIELSNPEHAFGHSIYPNILSEITIENAKTGLLKGNSKKKELPKQPYTPKLNNLSIDYKSSASISFKEMQSTNDDIIDSQGKLFHLHPFGKEMVFPTNKADSIKLIPTYDFTGALYLGFQNINAPQTISILFEMLDEFTISSEEEPPQIDWKYLANNEWHSIKPEHIIRDDTNGFLRTGVIMINVDGNINRNNTILNSTLYWLCVQCKANTEGASSLKSVHSQVVRATLIGNDNIYNSDYLENDIPAGTIQKPLKNLKGIKKIHQPLPSFNNKGAERDISFQTRISERLKTRNRAITNWDYERIILSEFSEIERVTCLPNMTSNNLNSPGNVLIVVSPYSSKVVNSEEPRASSELLFKIKSFLLKYISPFVSIEVRNPSYERIRVICSVKFSEVHNHGYYIQQLNAHINNFLSGNMGGDSHGTLAGKIVYCSDIITYIRTLPFILSVESFSIIQAATDLNGNYVLIDTADEKNEKDGLSATKPWSVLIPSSSHQITVLPNNKSDITKPAGIDNLQLGSDFIINE